MAATEGVGMGAAQQQQQQQPARAVERLNPAVQQQLNLDSVKTRATSLYKAISRILEELEVIGRTNAIPKWQDVLGQFSMVNLELFNIVEDIKKVSKAFVVHPKFVTAENATILPVMLSSKLLPEIEMDDNAKKDQLLHGMQNMPVSQQIEKLKMRIDMIGAACESAEKVIADTRKAYFGSRQGLTTIPTLDKVQAAKIQEQETSLRNAVNHGEGLRVHGDQKQITTSLPLHLVDVLTAGDGGQTFPDASGMYMKNTPVPSNNINNQGNLIQASGAQLIGRAAASPSGGGSGGGTGVPSFDNTAASPMQYANSPRSGTSMMNTPSPQQHSPQQQQQQQQLQQQQLQQQRQKMMQLPQHQQQQLMAQQQFRQPALSGLGQNQLGQLHDMQGQAQQKFQSMHSQHQMQFSSAMGTQQFQSRQLPSGAMQHAIGQNQLNQSNQINRHVNQFSNASSALFNNIAQNSPNPQMIPNMSATMSSQSLLPRMQFGLSGGNRMHGSQILSDQMFNMGAANPGNMMPMQQQQQQQQHGSQGGSFGNMPQNAQQNLQSNMVALQQNHPNFQQQRQQQNQP